MSNDTTPALTEEEKALAEPDPIPVVESEREVPEFGKPKYLVVGSSFIAQTDEGELRFPMKFKTKLIRSMPDGIIYGGDAMLEQIYWLLTNDPQSIEQGYPAILEKIDELDIEDARELARKYFQATYEKQQARLGESGRSSRS